MFVPIILIGGATNEGERWRLTKAEKNACGSGCQLFGWESFFLLADGGSIAQSE
jgi:hypothetical protein